MRHHRGAKGEHEDALNITPMIDVVFLLLIFFIATMQLPEPEAGLRAYLPKDDPKMDSASEKVEEQEEQVITHVIRLEPNRILFDNTELPNSFTGLRDQLAAVRVVADLPNAAPCDLVLDVGASVPYRLVVKTLEVCSGYGFTDVNFAMPPAGEPAS